jgi:hypothetical protein
MKIMLPTAMAASQATGSEKKSFLQRLMIDICSSRFCYRTATRKASLMPGKLFEGVVLDRTGEKTPARKSSGGRLGKAPVQQGVGWSGCRRNFTSPGEAGWMTEWLAPQAIERQQAHHISELDGGRAEYRHGMGHYQAGQ